MAFWTLGIFLLASALEMSFGNSGNCLEKIKGEKDIYAPNSVEANTPFHLNGTRPSFDVTVTIDDKEIKCNKSIDYLKLVKNKYVIKLSKETLDYYAQFEIFPYYTVLVWNAGSKLDIYLSKLFGTDPLCRTAIWAVTNIPAELFDGGFRKEDEKKGYVLYEFIPPIYCPASRIVIQIHRQLNNTINTPKTTTKRNPFNENLFEVEKVNKRNFRTSKGLVERDVTMDLPLSAILHRMELVHTIKIDKIFRDLENKIIKVLDELREKYPSIDKIKDDEVFKKLKEKYDLMRNATKIPNNLPEKEMKKKIEEAARKVIEINKKVPDPPTTPKPPTLL